MKVSTLNRATIILLTLACCYELARGQNCVSGGGRCRSGSACCSGYCFVGRCEDGEDGCVFGGGRCRSGSDCCSGYCFVGRCEDGQNGCVNGGGRCRSGSDCCSGACNFGRCEPGPNDCESGVLCEHEDSAGQANARK